MKKLALDKHRLLAAKTEDFANREQVDRSIEESEAFAEQLRRYQRPRGPAGSSWQTAWLRGSAECLRFQPE